MSILSCFKQYTLTNLFCDMDLYNQENSNTENPVLLKRNYEIQDIP